MDVVIFSHDAAYAAACMRAGMTGAVVDWENSGKARRQRGRQTQINRGTPEDLARLRGAISGRLICRINNLPGIRAAEARLARDIGADEVWLPMVRRIEEIEECFAILQGDCALGILAETTESMRLGKAFSALPLARVYVGLNDLQIDAGHRSLFEPLVDGTLDRFRDDYSGSFGVAGITHPASGAPIPQRLLLADMVRLRCDFGVARRAFCADVPSCSIAAALEAIRTEVARLRLRDAAQVERDRQRLRQAISAIHADAARAA